MTDAQFHFFAAVLCFIAARVWSNHAEIREYMKNPANAEKIKDDGPIGALAGRFLGNGIHWLLVIAAARYFWLYMSA